MKNALTVLYLAAGFVVGFLLRFLWSQDWPFVVKVTATVGGLVVYLAPMARFMKRPARL